MIFQKPWSNGSNCILDIHSLQNSSSPFQISCRAQAAGFALSGTSSSCASIKELSRASSCDVMSDEEDIGNCGSPELLDGFVSGFDIGTFKIQEKVQGCTVNDKF